MKTAKDSYSIDIVLRHASHDPETISAALSLKPKGFWPKGEDLGRVRAKWSFFYARLLDDVSSPEFERALKDVSRFLRKNSAFLADFTDGNGEVGLILNHTVSPQGEEGNKSFELHLSPDFLRDLSARDIGLRVQGWQGSVKADTRKKVRRSVGKL
jgi:hypothetical protein